MLKIASLLITFCALINPILANQCRHHAKKNQIAQQKNSAPSQQVQKIQVTPPAAKKELSQKNIPASTTKPLSAPSTPAKEIVVNDHITKDMITYTKHWSGHHAPSKFRLTLNGQELPIVQTKKVKKGETPVTSIAKTITADGNKLNIELYFKFSTMGVTHHEETKRYTAQLPDNAKNIEARFSWDAPTRILLEYEDKGKQQVIPVTENTQA